MKFGIKLGAAVIASLIFGSVAAYGQKAEPLRISFAKGKTSATVSNTLSNDEEMDFVFGASRGQMVTVKVSSARGGRLFDFSIGGDGFDLELEEDHYTELSFKAPETGDYQVSVRKLASQRYRTAKFYLVLTIR